jgi:hypothetical protein
MNNIRSLILHALISRVAYTDDTTWEFLINLKDNQLDVDIPRDKLDQLINEVVISDKLQDFIDWLTGKRISYIEDHFMDFIPYTSKTVYGKVKIGTGIDVAEGVISVTGGVGEQLVVVTDDYTVVHNPTIVVCKDTLNVTLPAEPSAGYRVVVKNSTPSETVTILATVDSEVNPTVKARESFAMVYDGTEWNII